MNRCAMRERSNTDSPTATPSLGLESAELLNTPYGRFSRGKWEEEGTGTQDTRGAMVLQGCS